MEGITVKEAYEILKEYGVKWVAGIEGENRVVKSVSVIEIPDCFEWLQGGEMILTTLYQYKTLDEKLELIEGLNKGNAACIAIHPGKEACMNIPDILIDLANNLRFPIFIIPKKLPYALIIKKIYEALLNKEELALKKSLEINSLMNQILISNGGVHEIIDRLSTIINNCVVFADEFFRPIAAVFRGKFKSNVEGMLSELCCYAKEYFKKNSNVRLQKEVREIARITIKNGFDVIVHVIKINEYIDNYLLIIQNQNLTESENELYKIALSSAITALKIERLKNLAVLEAEERLKFDFFDDIISGTYSSDELMKKRAKTIGLNLLDKNFVVIFDIDQFEQYYKENIEKGETHIQKVKMDLKKSIEEAIEKIRNRVILFLPKSDEYILIIGFNNIEYAKEAMYKNVLIDLFSKVTKNFTVKNPGITLSIGISSALESINELKRAYDEAAFAREIGNKLFGYGKIFFYDDLGIYKIISIPNKLEDILRDRWFYKLYDYDKNKNGNLIETLEIFLDNKCSIKETAKKLYTHPNTVKYRIKKVKELIGEDILQDEQKRLYYHILIKAIKMLQ
ncbi:MAG: PucR family transcriptional regulator [Thermovenabulum sp.]|uniref:PucR family transcriptional regulator n=1 Tax=Thermovenabulum sp. TaxID=3100335 RepID=UPI003C7E45AE